MMSDDGDDVALAAACYGLRAKSQRQQSVVRVVIVGVVFSRALHNVITFCLSLRFSHCLPCDVT